MTLVMQWAGKLVRDLRKAVLRICAQLEKVCKVKNMRQSSNWCGGKEALQVTKCGQYEKKVAAVCLKRFCTQPRVLSIWTPVFSSSLSFASALLGTMFRPLRTLS